LTAIVFGPVFRRVTLTTNVTLSVTASLHGHLGSALTSRTLILNGVRQLPALLERSAQQLIQLLIPAGTLLSTVTVEAIANGTGGGRLQAFTLPK
jgi:hypothetical protein